MKINNKIKAAITFLCTAAVAATLFIMPAAADEAQTYVDDLERSVTLEKAPERVASLLGSYASAWVLAGGELVAAPDDTWEDFDLDLPETCVDLGNTAELNLELLLAAEPDFVIASSKTELAMEWKDMFEEMNIPVMYFDVDNFADYLHMLDIFTQITGRSDLYEKNGLEVEKQIQNVIEKSAEALDGKEGPSVLFMRAAKTSVKAKGSSGTVLGEMLRDLGCVNISDGSDLLDNLTLEAIIAADPEYVFIVFQGDDSAAAQEKLNEMLINNPAWSGLSAVKEDKVYYMDKHLYHFKPNQLWGTAFQQLGEILYGEIFE